MKNPLVKQANVLKNGAGFLFHCQDDIDAAPEGQEAYSKGWVEDENRMSYKRYLADCKKRGVASMTLKFLVSV